MEGKIPVLADVFVKYVADGVRKISPVETEWLVTAGRAPPAFEEI